MTYKLIFTFLTLMTVVLVILSTVKAFKQNDRNRLVAAILFLSIMFVFQALSIVVFVWSN